MDTHPLTVGQESLCFLQELAPESSAYTVLLPVRIFEPLDREVLQDAVHDLATRHALLRSFYSAPGTRSVASADVLRLDELLLGSLASRLNSIASHAFDVTRPPLCRISVLPDADGDVLVVSAHHAFADIASLGIALSDLLHIYRAYTAGLSRADGPLAFFDEQVRRELDHVGSPQEEADLAHWSALLSDAPQQLDLPTDIPRASSAIPLVGDAAERRLGHSTVQGVIGQARAIEVTPFSMYVSAFQAVLARWTGQDDFLVGSTTSIRPRHHVNVVGYYVNPVVLRCSHPKSMSLADLARTTHEQFGVARLHNLVPFSRVVDHVRTDRSTERSPLFQVLVTGYVARPGDILGCLFANQDWHEFAGVTVQRVDPPPQQAGQFELTLELQMTPSTVDVVLKYNTTLFERTTAEQLLDWFTACLTEIVEDPGIKVGSLSLGRAHPVVERPSLREDPVRW